MNIKRSKAFVKIKHNINASKNLSHTKFCRDMVTVANGLLDKDEIVILKEYLQAKEKEFAPIEVIREKEFDGVFAEDDNK